MNLHVYPNYQKVHHYCMIYMNFPWFTVKPSFLVVKDNQFLKFHFYRIIHYRPFITYNSIWIKITLFPLYCIQLAFITFSDLLRDLLCQIIICILIIIITLIHHLVRSIGSQVFLFFSSQSHRYWTCQCLILDHFYQPTQLSLFHFFLWWKIWIIFTLLFSNYFALHLYTNLTTAHH